MLGINLNEFIVVEVARLCCKSCPYLFKSCKFVCVNMQSIKLVEIFAAAETRQ